MAGRCLPCLPLIPSGKGLTSPALGLQPHPWQPGRRCPSVRKLPYVSSADILTLLRNPVAPFLTICAYTHLKSQIFLTSSDVWSRDSKSSSASPFSLFLISKLKSRSYQFFPPNIPRTCQFLSISTAATLAQGLGTPGPGYRTASWLLPQQPLPVLPPTMPLWLSPCHNVVFVAIVAVPAHVESQLLVDRLVSPAWCSRGLIWSWLTRPTFSH